MQKQHISHLKLSNPDSKEWIFQSNEEHQKSFWYLNPERKLSVLIVFFN